MSLGVQLLEDEPAESALNKLRESEVRQSLADVVLPLVKRDTQEEKKRTSKFGNKKGSKKVGKNQSRNGGQKRRKDGRKKSSKKSKKDRKNKNQKKGKRKRNCKKGNCKKPQRQSDCSVLTCLNEMVFSLKIEKDTVRNFLAQEKRVNAKTTLMGMTT